MTPLEAHLHRRIRLTGPLTIAEYMHEALLHPQWGYYTTRDPFGVDGDFVTAPDISQMFGELIGLALAQQWLNLGQPSAFTLAELGPGRGTLMADALRATKGVAGFRDAMDVVFVEASPKLQAHQAKAVPEARWVSNLAELPEQPLLLIANEYFDALPIRQFQRDGNGWRERVVGLREDALVIGLSDAVYREELAHRLDDTTENQIVEHSAASQGVAAAIGAHIAQFGGVALVVDYGDWRSRGDTLQAVRRHKSVDVLDRPGSADITAHVDFEAIAHAAKPAKTSVLTAQGVFLNHLGIRERAANLMHGQSEETQKTVFQTVKRLTGDAEMGHLFKVLAVYSGESPPPGVLS